MTILRNRATALGICAAIALLTAVVRHTLWQHGEVYWLTLESLAVLQTVVSAVALFVYPRPWPFVICVVTLLIVGQLWAVESIAVGIIWSFGRFAP